MHIDIKNERLLLFIIISIALLSRFFAYHIPVPQNLSDAGDYIGMGKYIFSLGKVGFWVPRRSILLPLMLGSFWKLGCGPILCGNILEILFSAGSIFLVYLIGTRVFDKKAGLLAAIFLSISHIYFVMGSQFEPRTPATFFGLLAVYYFLNNGYRLSGLFSALAILAHITHFPLYGFLFLLPLLREDKPMHASKDMIKFFLGSLFIFIPFFLSHIIMYRGAFTPIKEAYVGIADEGCAWSGPTLLYLEHIFLRKEPIILLLSLIGAFLIIKKPGMSKVSILSIGTIFLIFIHMTPNKSLRYVIPSLPYLYMVSAYAFFNVYDYIKERKHVVAVSLVILLCMYVALNFAWITLFMHHQNSKMTAMDPYQQYVQQNEKAMQGSIWISSGDMLIYSNLKASKLMWHPILHLEQVMRLQKELSTADWILFDTAMMCYPTGKYTLDETGNYVLQDEKCAQELRNLTKTIISQFKAERYFTNSKGEFIGGIFKRSP